MSIYITGDIHGDITRFSELYIPNESELTEQDCIIVCGDFGLIWYNKDDYKSYRIQQNNLDNLSARPYKILFCDGNHENFNEIYNYEAVEIYGGRAHKIRDNIYHLMRGEIYDIEGKKIFVMGGAYSIDKYMRQENISWWEQELPNDDEYKNAVANIKKANNKVDYIISHTAPSEIIKLMGFYPDIHDAELTGFFDWLMYETDFKHWYFGHWHIDEPFDFKHYGKEKCFRAVYFDVLKIDEQLDK